jgi:hypothetical protein
VKTARRRRIGWNQTPMPDRHIRPHEQRKNHDLPFVYRQYHDLFGSVKKNRGGGNCPLLGLGSFGILRPAGSLRPRLANNALMNLGLAVMNAAAEKRRKADRTWVGCVG